MDDRDTIRRRIIDQAVALFDVKNTNGGGLFTTAHYGQAMKAEFKTPGPTLDGETCMEHLSHMDDLVEKAGGNLWRRKARQGDPVRADGATSVQTEILANKQNFPSGTGDDMILEIGSRIEAGVLQILADGAAGKLGTFGSKILWWSIESMTSWFRKYETKDFILVGDLESLVALTFRALEADGKVVAMRDIMVAGTCGTWFGLAMKGSEDNVHKSGNGVGKLIWPGLEFLHQPRSGVRLDVARERQLIEIEDAVETSVMGILAGKRGAVPDIGLDGAMWWSVGTMADALKNSDLPWGSLLENMVGLMLYTMAVDGRVVSRPNILVDGARVTVFALVVKDEPAVNG